MKRLLTAVLLVSAPLVLLAQTAPAKPAGTTATTNAKAASAKNPPLRRSAKKAVEEVTPIDSDTNITLSQEDFDVAKRVHIGNIACELGASVTITPNEKRPGFFTVSTKGSKFNMHPVGSRTGAIRLEDPRAGAMWLQLGNKSMLMSQKLGQRLADECASPEQITFADDLKKNPRPSILDAPMKP
jgi:Ni/Co efflux regulator RcnB